MLTKKISLLLILIVFNSCIETNENKEEVKDSETSLFQNDLVTCSFYNIIDVKPEIEISGTINSKNKVDLISEVNGKVYSKRNKFKVGNEFKKGQTLIRIEAADLKLEIKSIKSEFLSLLIQCLPDLKIDYPNSFTKWDSYVENFDINKRMRDLPNIQSKKLRNYLSGRGVYSLFYRIMSLENKLDKFSIKAPFDCIVTQSFLSTGSNVLIGQRLGQIIDKKNYEISTSLGVAESQLFDIGDKAIFSSDDMDKTFIGTIKRKGNHINSLTQSIDIFFDISDENVKDGMFVKGKVFGNDLTDVYQIPRNKLHKNKFVFLLEDFSLKEKEIQVIYFKNDSVIISNLKNNDCIIDNYRSYYYDGMKVN